MTYYTSIIIMTLLALAVLSIQILENDRISKEKKRIFLTTNVFIALAAVAECAGIHISGNPEIPKGVLAAVKAVDYTFTPMTAGALIALMQEPNKKSLFLRGLFIGNATLQVISAFQGWMVVIDSQNHYTHGYFYPVYMALYLLVIILLAIKMLAYGKSFRKQNRVSLYATMILLFIGIGIQELSGWGCRIAYLAAAFTAAFLYIHYCEFSQLCQDEKITEQQIKLTNDPLTGVFSRFAYDDEIEAYSSGIPDSFVVFLIDINGLKAVNDSIGHEAGDELICGAAGCIEICIGKRGKTFRIGGDEFVVFATMKKEQVKEVIRNLKDKTARWSGKDVDSLSLSIGYALVEEHEGLSVRELVEEADKAMYEQKKAYYQMNGHDRRSNRV